MHQDVAYAFEDVVGLYEDWTSVNPSIAIMHMIALISGRVFVGPELNRNSG